MALSIEDVRVYTKDIEELNILLEGEDQSSDDLISLAMRLAVSEFNSIPPASTFIVDNFPGDALLLQGTVHFLANSEAERQLRNQVSFNTQGGQASIDDKFQQYLALASTYGALFDAKAKALKQHLNVESGWGDSFSPYIAINDFNFRS